jgi:GGDEF domain-containing protein
MRLPRSYNKSTTILLGIIQVIVIIGFLTLGTIENELVFTGFGILIVFQLFLTLRDRTHIKQLYKRIKHLTKETYHLKREKEAQSAVARELSHRIGFQEDAILILYSQLKKMDRLDFQEGLDNLLETLQVFTLCSKASIWKLNLQDSRAELICFLGYDRENRPFPYLPLDQSIQGWVGRNNRLYSVRMIREYPDLYDVQDGKTIMAMPLNLQGRPWGVISVEDMPFERYNSYTESLVNLLLKLLEPALDNLYNLDLTFNEAEWDPVTGLPLYSLLVRNLTSQLTHAIRTQASLSLLIIELIPLKSNRVDGDQTKKDQKQQALLILELLEQEFPDQHRLYHFKQDNQFAAIIPNINEQGLARLSLNILSRLSMNQGLPDVIIGYSCSENFDNPEVTTLIGEAEKILELQRI